MRERIEEWTKKKRSLCRQLNRHMEWRVRNSRIRWPLMLKCEIISIWSAAFFSVRMYKMGDRFESTRPSRFTNRSIGMYAMCGRCLLLLSHTHARTFFLWESSFDIIQSELLMNLHSLSAHYIEYIQIKYLAKNRNTHKKCCIRFKYKSNNLCFSFQFKSVSMISVPKRIIHTQNTFNHKSHNN